MDTKDTPTRGGEKDQASATPVRWAVRVVLYLVGVAILALGVSLSRRAALGLSQLVAWPAVIADIDPNAGRNMGWWVGAVFVLFVIVEIAVLRRDFKPIQLLQIPISLMYGFLVNMWNGVTAAIPMPNYPVQLLFSVLSVCTMAVGISIYLVTDVVPLSSEGLALAITTKSGKPFPRIKQAFDISLIVLAVITGLIGLGTIRYVREGTVIAAFCLGPFIGVANRFVRPILYPLCYGRPERKGK